jgi:hypothetical protein
MIAMPLQTTGADREIVCITRDAAATALCHGPPSITAIQSHIQGTKIFWIS